MRKRSGLGWPTTTAEQMGQQSNVSPMESLQLLQGKVPQQMLQQQPQLREQPQIQQQALPRLNEHQLLKLLNYVVKNKRTHKQKHEAFKFNKEFIKKA